MKQHSTLLPATILAALIASGAGACGAAAPALRDAFDGCFLVGAAINRAMATGSPSRWRTREQLDADLALVRGQFNQITAENDLKWALIHPREGADGFDFGPADAFVQFGLDQGMYLVGHTLVWHSQTPSWVFAGTNPPPEAVRAAATSGPIREATTLPEAGRFRRGMDGGPGRSGYQGPRASREELLARMRDHIRTVVGRYRGRIKAWDVVNEALADGGPDILRNSLWRQIIGPDYIAKAFEYAHEADPEALLRYNDYGLENPAKRRNLITLVRSLLNAGVPVMAIGTQAHLNVSGATFESMDDCLTELATLGLPIHVTELDINSAQGGQRSSGADLADNAGVTQGGLVEEADERLARAYEGVFRAFAKHREAVAVVTFWGANDANSWRRNGRPLLFDGESRPKSAFDAVIRVAAESERGGR